MITKKHIKTLSDEQIVSLYKETKNKKCIGELYERYSHLVYGVCLKYLQHVDEAKDSLMQIFEKLINDLLKYEITTFKPWLYQSSKNQCLMKLRKNKKTNFVAIEKLNIEEDNTELNNKKKKEIAFTNLEKAIDLLNENQKKCIQLFYLQKKSYQQIVAETTYSLKEVKSNIQNGKRKLKILIENQQNSNNKEENEFI